MLIRWSAVAVGAGAVLLAVVPVHAAVPGAAGCPVFPADNVWHADVSTLPVHARTNAWITSMGGAARHLHPDFGPNGTDQPYGIPYIVVPGSHAKVSVAFDYADESDAGPYPLGPDTPIEGGSDRHALMIDRDACRLYELYNATYNPNGSTAGSGAIWDLRSNTLRPSTWTSADAAGLPIFPGLLRRDEVAAGAVDHAIRVTAQRTDRSFIWPARHQAGAANDANLPPMGARFRMKANVDITHYRPDTQAVLRAMKRYGVIVADNGSNWFFTGTSEPGWDDNFISELKSIPAGDFEAVDESSLMVDPDSGRVRAGTAAPAPARPPVRRATTAPTAPPATTTTGAPATSTTSAPTATTSTTVPARAAAARPDPRRSPSHAPWWWLVGLTVAAAAGGTGIAIRRRRRPT